MVKLKRCRGLIKPSDLWVTSHEKLSDFYASSWQRGDSPIPLLVVRLVALMVALSILIWALYEGFNIYWLIFLTNWGLLLVTAMFLSGVGVSIAAVCKRIPDEGEAPWYVGMYWFLHNVAVSVALMITALYWILLYDPNMKELMGTRLFALELSTHGLNSVLVMVEVLAARTPVSLIHLYQPLGVGLWYGAFTGIYYLAGGTGSNDEPFIYEVLDWRQSRRSLIIIGVSAAGLIGIYCFVYGISFCRDKFTNFVFRTTSVKLAYVPPDVPRMPDTKDFV